MIGLLTACIKLLSILALFSLVNASSVFSFLSLLYSPTSSATFNCLLLFPVCAIPAVSFTYFRFDVAIFAVAKPSGDDGYVATAESIGCNCRSTDVNTAHAL